MTTHFLQSDVRLLIKTCHRRNVHAMGGMAAQIPIKNDPAANEAAMTKVRADKEREANEGHDGTWVAHPGLVALAKDVFDNKMPVPNQIARKRQDVHVTAADLLKVPTGTITEAGLRSNINIGLGYLESWLRGIGCVPLYHLMEDAATAEISRSQVWQWRRHGAVLADGRKVTRELCRETLEEELAKLKASATKGQRFDDAAKLFLAMVESDRFVEFLTLPAYERIAREGA
jgi:malate synthase